MPDEKIDIEKEFREGTKIDAALKRAVRRALLENKRAGNPVVVMRDGKMTLVSAEDIRVDEEEHEDDGALPASE
jgi:hypothetical protein